MSDLVERCCYVEQDHCDFEFLLFIIMFFGSLFSDFVFVVLVECLSAFCATKKNMLSRICRCLRNPVCTRFIRLLLSRFDMIRRCIIFSLSLQIAEVELIDLKLFVRWKKSAFLPSINMVLIFQVCGNLLFLKLKCIFKNVFFFHFLYTKWLSFKYFQNFLEFYNFWIISF